MAERHANNAVTTLSSGINNAVTTIAVASASAFPNSGDFRIIVESEIMKVTAVSGNNFTVVRGTESTTAASHASGTTVAHVMTAEVVETFAVRPADSQDNEILRVDGAGSKQLQTTGYSIQDTGAITTHGDFPFTLGSGSLATLQTGTTGNARGQYAVDFQAVRTNNARVASGHTSALLGTTDCTAAANQSVVIGSNGCDIELGVGTYNVILGSANCSMTTELSGNATNAFIGGSNTCKVYQRGGVVIGGYWTENRAQYSLAVGKNVLSTHKGSINFGSGCIHVSQQGHDCKATGVVLKNSTTNGTETELFIDTSDRLAIPPYAVWSFTIHICAKHNGSADAAGWKYEGVIENDGSTTAMLGVQNAMMYRDQPTWTVSVEADNDNDALIIKVTGEAAKTIYWAARVDFIEVILDSTNETAIP